ncbi:MAG: zinc-ribbon domain-containing protein [Thermoleophilia bacterium]
MFCNNCGASIEPGSSFCESCGSPVGAPGNALPGLKTGRKINPTQLFMVAGLIGALLVGGYFFINRSETKSPDVVVNNFAEAIEKQDQIAALDCIAPYERDILIDYIPKVMELLQKDKRTRNQIRSSDNALNNLEINIDGMRYETKIEGDKADVNLIDGFITVKPIDGKKRQFSLPEDFNKEYEIPATIKMVKISDRWYVSITRTFGGAYLRLFEDLSIKYYR